MDKIDNKNTNYFLYSCLAGFGLAIILTSGKTDKTSVTTFQVAYSVLFFVICFKTAIIGSKLNFDNFIAFLVMIFPFLTILAVILWILILVFLYYDRITEGKVSDYYTSFMNIASAILLIQIYMIFSEVSDKTPPLSSKTYSILRLLSVLAGLSVITVSIVLKFYVTDC